jgi:hypothetical protein
MRKVQDEIRATLVVAGNGDPTSSLRTTSRSCAIL